MQMRHHYHITSYGDVVVAQVIVGVHLEIDQQIKQTQFKLCFENNFQMELMLNK